MGERVGYTRVSTLAQNVDRQLDGLELDRVFTDKASGKDVARPALGELLRFVRAGHRRGAQPGPARAQLG